MEGEPKFCCYDGIYIVDSEPVDETTLLAFDVKSDLKSGVVAWNDREHQRVFMFKPESWRVASEGRISFQRVEGEGGGKYSLTKLTIRRYDRDVVPKMPGIFRFKSTGDLQAAYTNKIDEVASDQCKD